MPINQTAAPSAITGCSFQFGRTSTHLPRRPHLMHLILVRNHVTRSARRMARHVDQDLVPARVVEAIGDQVMHPELAHVAERHRRAGRVLGIGELNAEDRAHYQRREALLRDQFDRWLKSTRIKTTPRDDVVATVPQNQLSVEERRGYGSGRRAKGDSDSLRKIVKQYGIMPLAKMIADSNDAHSVGEAELMQYAGEYAATKGISLGKLLSADTGEGALLSKAAAICRQGQYARQAQHSIEQMRARVRGS
jgi:hypothetical protein